MTKIDVYCPMVHKQVTLNVKLKQYVDPVLSLAVPRTCLYFRKNGCVHNGKVGCLLVESIQGNFRREILLEAQR